LDKDILERLEKDQAGMHQLESIKDHQFKLENTQKILTFFTLFLALNQFHHLSKTQLPTLLPSEVRSNGKIGPKA